MQMQLTTREICYNLCSAESNWIDCYFHLVCRRANCCWPCLRHVAMLSKHLIRVKFRSKKPRHKHTYSVCLSVWPHNKMRNKTSIQSEYKLFYSWRLLWISNGSHSWQIVNPHHSGPRGSCIDAWRKVIVLIGAEVMMMSSSARILALGWRPPAHWAIKYRLAIRLGPFLVALWIGH